MALKEHLTPVEKTKVELLKEKMNNARTRWTVLFYEWRIHQLLNKVKERVTNN